MVLSCLALSDSTGYGLKEQLDHTAEIVLDNRRQRINVISPGSSLCSAWKREHQLSLTSLLATEDKCDFKRKFCVQRLLV